MITVPISASSPYVKVTSYSDASAIGEKPTVSRSRIGEISGFEAVPTRLPVFLSLWAVANMPGER